MLESAVGQAEDDGPEVLEGFARSRLSCQIRLTPELDGLTVTIPEVEEPTFVPTLLTDTWHMQNLYNMLEVPLWMRNR